MKKWLVITLLALSVFITILLGLGYLLSENEKRTTILKNQLEQAAQLASEKSRQRNNLSDYLKTLKVDDAQATSKPTAAIIKKTFESTLINNLTCVSLAQCQVITIKFKNKDCKLASNTIGASLLNKIATDTITMQTCPTFNPQSQLVCQQNICSLISSDE